MRGAAQQIIVVASGKVHRRPSFNCSLHPESKAVPPKEAIRRVVRRSLKKDRTAAWPLR
jgi:hypothetical protein